MTVAAVGQIALKLLASFLAVILLWFFLSALWRRDVDMTRYGTRNYWLGRWFEAWFPENPNLLKNGDFERGWLGWGSGWIETMPNNREHARKHRFLNLMGAQSKWSPQSEGGRGNSGALKIEHYSKRQDHVF